MTLTFNPQLTLVMTHAHAKNQGKRSLGSKDRVETDGRPNGPDLLHYRAH